MAALLTCFEWRANQELVFLPARCAKAAPDGTQGCLFSPVSSSCASTSTSWLSGGFAPQAVLSLMGAHMLCSCTSTNNMNRPRVPQCRPIPVASDVSKTYPKALKMCLDTHAPENWLCQRMAKFSPECSCISLDLSQYVYAPATTYLLLWLQVYV